jgi:hypothetical protein
MRVSVVDVPGGPDVVKHTQIPVPGPGPAQPRARPTQPVGKREPYGRTRIEVGGE